MLVFSFYFGDVSFPLAFTILTANLSTLILISNNEKIGKRSYFLVGCLMGFMYVVMPQTWPLIIFIILHIFATSSNISANLFPTIFWNSPVVYELRRILLSAGYSRLLHKGLFRMYRIR